MIGSGISPRKASVIVVKIFFCRSLKCALCLCLVGYGYVKLGWKNVELSCMDERILSMWHLSKNKENKKYVYSIYTYYNDWMCGKI